MTKLKLWSSATGLIGMFFLVAGIVGAVLQFVALYLPAFTNGLYGDPWDLIFFIVSIAAMAFLGLLLILSIFGIPKVLWGIFVFLGLACVIVPPIIIAAQTGIFFYVYGIWYLLLPMDFIGFWLAAGGALIALILGLVTRAE